MGGTISNLYGGKIGIEKILPGTMKNGIQGKKIIGIEVKTNSRFKISGAKSFQKNFKPDKLLLIGDA